MSRLSATPWTAVNKAPLSMEFSRPEYWSGLPFPPPGGLSDPGIKPRSPALQASIFYHLSHQGTLSSVCIQNIPPPHYLQPHHNHGHQTLPENMSQHYSSWEGLQWSPRDLCFCPYFPTIYSPDSIINDPVKM